MRKFQIKDNGGQVLDVIFAIDEVEAYDIMTEKYGQNNNLIDLGPARDRSWAPVLTLKEAA